MYASAHVYAHALRAWRTGRSPHRDGVLAVLIERISTLEARCLVDSTGLRPLRVIDPCPHSHIPAPAWEQTRARLRVHVRVHAGPKGHAKRGSESPPPKSVNGMRYRVAVCCIVGTSARNSSAPQCSFATTQHGDDDGKAQSEAHDEPEHSRYAVRWLSLTCKRPSCKSSPQARPMDTPQSLHCQC